MIFEATFITSEHFTHVFLSLPFETKTLSSCNLEQKCRSGGRAVGGGGGTSCLRMIQSPKERQELATIQSVSSEDKVDFSLC